MELITDKEEKVGGNSIVNHKNLKPQFSEQSTVANREKKNTHKFDSLIAQYSNGSNYEQQQQEI
jgi:hypothetical protein